MSASTENFIKVVYQFQHNEGFDTKPGSIAKALRITNAAATDMARKLAVKNLVEYQKYKKLRLTTKGEKLALNVIRKHRLWETFLYKTLGLGLHEIHREAEMLEHQTSDFLAGKLNDFLGYPEVDPHGDPIPEVSGKVNQVSNSINLSMASPKGMYQVNRLFSYDEEFFGFCKSNNIEVGAEITVVNQYPTNKMIEIQIEQTKLLLSEEFAKKITIIPIH